MCCLFDELSQRCIFSRKKMNIQSILQGKIENSFVKMSFAECKE